MAIPEKDKGVTGMDKPTGNDFLLTVIMLPTAVLIGVLEDNPFFLRQPRMVTTFEENGKSNIRLEPLPGVPGRVFLGYERAPQYIMPKRQTNIYDLYKQVIRPEVDQSLDDEIDIKSILQFSENTGAAEIAKSEPKPEQEETV